MISIDLRKEIYNILKDEDLIVNTVQNGNFMNIVSSIWDIYEMPATGEDFRYNNYGDELEKHFVMNSDWNIDKVFINKLKLLENEDTFNDFLLKILIGNNFKFNQTPPCINNIQLSLKKENMILLLINKEGLCSFSLSLHGDYLSDIKDNKIPFYVVERKGNLRSDNSSSHDVPNNTPCFILVYNDGWNDYGCYSWFSLFYYKKKDCRKLIGNVKIIKSNESQTFDVIDKKFHFLSDDFCSLGMDVGYYNTLREVFHEEAWSILKALRDAAAFNNIEEKFFSNSNFKDSLCRENSSEKALREGLYCIEGKDMTESYSFTYKFQPKYSEDYTNILFDFKYDSKPFQRIIGLIGENGVGKTTLLRELPQALGRKNEIEFEGELPLYSKIIAVSYSPFDRFVKLEEHKAFNYEYCGLMKNENEIYSQKEQSDKLIEQVKKIHRRNLIDQWINLLNIIIDTTPLAEIIAEENDGKIKISKRKMLEYCNILSSGQLNYLMATTAIVANIRYDALLLFDEPEQHLHPNAVTALMKGIYHLLEKFKSYAIIATHSPLIIRELVSDNVYILTRSSDLLSIAKICIECFGEDISILNDNIFGNKDQVKRFEEFIRRYVKKGNSYNDILDLIETDNIPLGLNAKLLIRREILNNEKD